MRKLNKTQTKLLQRHEGSRNGIGFTGYQGIRETNAVLGLEKMGLVEVRPCDGTYEYRTWNGDYETGYEPQGTFKLIES